MKKLTAVFLAIVTALSLCVSSFAAEQTPAEKANLRFDENGKFRVMVLADIQDNESLSQLSQQFILKAVEEYSPDLLVLTGDNIYGKGMRSAKKSENALRKVLEMLEKTGVPYASVFGNHDSDKNGYAREDQMKVYGEYPHNLAIDEDVWVDGVNYSEALENCGTYYVPVRGSDGSDDVKYVFWMFDTGDYDPDNGGYDHVRDKQIEWFKTKDAQLGSPNGMAFQHIIVPEIYSALEKASWTDKGSVIYRKNFYKLPSNATPESHLGEMPNPSEINGGEFEALSSTNVQAVISGHDHTNSFIVPYNGVDIINVPTCGVGAYGETDYRGVRYFDIDEETLDYTTDFVTYADLFSDDTAFMIKFKIVSFFTSITFFFSKNFQRITNLLGISNLVI